MINSKKVTSLLLPILILLINYSDCFSQDKPTAALIDKHKNSYQFNKSGKECYYKQTIQLEGEIVIIEYIGIQVENNRYHFDTTVIPSDNSGCSNVQISSNNRLIGLRRLSDEVFQWFEIDKIQNLELNKDSIFLTYQTDESNYVSKRIRLLLFCYDALMRNDKVSSIVNRDNLRDIDSSKRTRNGIDRKKIENKIAQDKTKETIDIIREFLKDKDDDFKNEIILINGNLERLNNAKINGTISGENFRVEKTKINEAILLLMKKI